MMACATLLGLKTKLSERTEKPRHTSGCVLSLKTEVEMWGQHWRSTLAGEKERERIPQ